jgi:DNA-binding NarL/FixJ family response regulator
VLLADDYPAMHIALTRLLTPLYDVVGSVSDGRTVLEATTRLQPDVVVIDVGLPGVNGLDACLQLKAAAPAVSVIVFTAADDASLRARAIEVGASAFVLKFRANDLVPAIQRAVAGINGPVVSDASQWHGHPEGPAWTT